MASRGKPAEARRPAPRLYLVTPQATILPGCGTLARRSPPPTWPPCCCACRAADDRNHDQPAKALAPAVQDKGAALMLDGHAELVARAGADGAHLAGIDAFSAALATLKPGAHRRLRRSR